MDRKITDPPGPPPPPPPPAPSFHPVLQISTLEKNLAATKAELSSLRGKKDECEADAARATARAEALETKHSASAKALAEAREALHLESAAVQRLTRERAAELEARAERDAAAAAAAGDAAEKLELERAARSELEEKVCYRRTWIGGGGVSRGRRGGEGMEFLASCPCDVFVRRVALV